MSEHRYRLLFRVPSAQNSQSTHDGCWREVGHEFAGDAEAAVRRAAKKTGTPTEGNWLALAEGTGHWQEFKVARVEEIVITPEPNGGRGGMTPSRSSPTAARPQSVPAVCWASDWDRARAGVLTLCGVVMGGCVVLILLLAHVLRARM